MVVQGTNLDMDDSLMGGVDSVGMESGGWSFSQSQRQIEGAALRKASQFLRSTSYFRHRT